MNPKLLKAISIVEEYLDEHTLSECWYEDTDDISDFPRIEEIISDGNSNDGADIAVIFKVNISDIDDETDGFVDERVLLRYTGNYSSWSDLYWDDGDEPHLVEEYQELVTFYREVK